jgi:hypothetical protein
MNDIQQTRTAAKACTFTVRPSMNVQRGFKPPAGDLLRNDVQGLMIIGPEGGIGTTPLMARTLEIMTGAGRHTEHDLVAAGWRDIEHLQQGLVAFGDKLHRVGLALSRHKSGLRIKKAKAA